MDSQKTNAQDGFSFTEIGKLRHENHYLKERVNNLEVFKKSFFTANRELATARNRLDELEQQLNLHAIKNRIVCLSDNNPGNTDTDMDAIHNILDFMRKGLSASGFEDLVASVFSAVDGMDVELAIQIRAGHDNLNFSLDEKNGSRNIQLLDAHKAEGDVIAKHNYIVINQPHFSLLANNLPVDSPEVNRHFKDYLKVISISANSYINVLMKEHELKELRRNIYKVFRKTHESFESMRNNIDRQIIQVSDLYLEFERDLVSLLSGMGLSEVFMKQIKALIHDARAELNLLLTSSLTIDEQFLAAIIKLEKAYAMDYGEKE